jgi:ABC-type uncharacterized transport system YnjBCD permease subunit
MYFVREMRLIISGLAGVIAACLVFSALILSRSDLEMMLGSPSNSLPVSPINVRLTTSGFTEPRGIGSQALLTINVTSSVDAANVSLEISIRKAYEDWPSQGIELVSGFTSWKGDLLANVSAIFNPFALVNVTQIGYGRIVAEVTWYDSSSNWEHYSLDQLGIVVLEDEILVVEDLGGVLPYFLPPGSNPMPPWPFPIPENFTGP